MVERGMTLRGDITHGVVTFWGWTVLGLICALTFTGIISVVDATYVDLLGEADDAVSHALEWLWQDLRLGLSWYIGRLLPLALLSCVVLMGTLAVFARWSPHVALTYRYAVVFIMILVVGMIPWITGYIFDIYWLAPKINDIILIMFPSDWYPSWQHHLGWYAGDIVPSLICLHATTLAVELLWAHGHRVNPERTCFRCGYNLRGLSATSSCPECGASDD